MNLDDIELHDGLITNALVDYENQTVTIAIKYYKGSESSERTSANIIFEGVSELHQISSLEKMRKNAFAGTISYWTPAAKKEDTTYIYLTGGCIAITASVIKFDPMPDKAVHA